MVDMWKWRNASFSRGCWKSFPTDLVKMQEPQEDRHFRTSMPIFTAMAGEHRKRRQSSNQASTVISHLVKPAPSLRITRRVDHP